MAPTHLAPHSFPTIRKEQATDRPDLMARVFKLKLSALLKELLDDMVFGGVMAWTYVVEFQKRGLPHAHLLLIMVPNAKPRTPEDIDARIVAELPDPRSPDSAELAHIISRSMVLANHVMPTLLA